MTTGDNIQKEVAAAIADKILINLKDDNHQSKYKTFGGETRR